MKCRMSEAFSKLSSVAFRLASTTGGLLHPKYTYLRQISILINDKGRFLRNEYIRMTADNKKQTPFELNHKNSTQSMVKFGQHQQRRFRKQFATVHDDETMWEEQLWKMVRRSTVLAENNGRKWPGWSWICDDSVSWLWELSASFWTTVKSQTTT